MIDEDIVFNKFEKVGEKRKNPNGMKSSGVLHEGAFKVRNGKFSTGEPFFMVDAVNGYYMRSSPIQEVIPIKNGFHIITENSIYEVTQ